MLKNKNKKKGFTLIELIIVIAIIAILAAIAIPKFGDIRKNAALKSDIANAKVIANAASALIADGRITIPSEKKEINITSQNTATYEGSSDGDNQSAPSTQETWETKAKTDIIGYLQNTPTPETSGYDDFIIYIDTSGNINVTMDGTDVDELNLYPGEVKKVEQSKI